MHNTVRTPGLILFAKPVAKPVAKPAKSVAKPTPVVGLHRLGTTHIVLFGTRR